MPISAYARRYARTAFEMARESHELSAWHAGLRKLAGLARDEALCAWLARQGVPLEERMARLTERTGELHPMVHKLASMLVARGRFGLFEDIYDEFQRRLDEYQGVQGVEVAEVTTAVELDDEQKLRIARRITEIIGRPVVLRPRVDPDVVGGIIIRVGDRVIDGCIRSQLEALRRRLSRAAS